MPAKQKTVFICNECGYESAKWMGKCPACGTWNSFFEEKLSNDKGSKGEPKRKVSAEPLNTFVGKESFRTKTGFEELDRVLGGGLVKGSLVLLGGEPGIGKSTLILQLCNKLKGEGKVSGHTASVCDTAKRGRTGTQTAGPRYRNR